MGKIKVDKLIPTMPKRFINIDSQENKRKRVETPEKNNKLNNSIKYIHSSVNKNDKKLANNCKTNNNNNLKLTFASAIDMTKKDNSCKNILNNKIKNNKKEKKEIIHSSDKK